MGQIAVSGIESAHPSISIPPRPMMKRIVGLISMALILSACTQKSAYETAVKNMAPFYCYKSLAGVVIIGWSGVPQAHQERPGQHL